jgi:penicillin-binding protein 1A
MAKKTPAAAPAARRAPSFRQRHAGLLRALLLLVVLGASLAAGGAFAAWTLICRGGACPSAGVLESYTPRQTSKLFAADGRFIAEIGNERRTLATLKDIPPVVREAFLVTEDKRFYDHDGVDWFRVPGAVVRNVRARRWKEGFSTITMQLARNIFTEDLSREKTVLRKLREAKVRRDIEREYPKDKILELYLNQIYLGAGAYGVETAAQRYFGKSVREVNLAEAALLAALPKGPVALRPAPPPGARRAAPQHDPRADAREGIVSDADASLAKAYPLELASRARAARRALLRRVGAPQLEEKFGRQLYEDGLKVYTTLDPDMQSAAERALQAQLEPSRRGATARTARTYEQYAARRERRGERAEARSPYLQGAFVALDPRTGRGARPRRRARLRRLQVQPRHAGAAAARLDVQAVVYAAAVQNGRMPSSLVDDAPSHRRRLEPRRTSTASSWGPHARCAARSTCRATSPPCRSAWSWARRT